MGHNVSTKAIVTTVTVVFALLPWIPLLGAYFLLLVVGLITVPLREHVGSIETIFIVLVSTLATATVLFMGYVFMRARHGLTELLSAMFVWSVLHAAGFSAFMTIQPDSHFILQHIAGVSLSVVGMFLLYNLKMRRLHSDRGLRS